MIKDYNIRRIFIKEALKNKNYKNYSSYRMDLLLFKVMASFIVFIITYFINLDLTMSVLTSLIVFFVLTLINKINLDKKNQVGEELLLSRVKREYFSAKIEEMNSYDFELLIKYFFEKEGYKNIIKKGRSMYLTEKEGYISIIKVFKLLEGTEVEKLDIRSLLTYMGTNNIRKGYLINTGNLTEDANALLNKFKDKFELETLDIDGLYSLADKHNMLPDTSFYYNKIYEQRKTLDRKVVIGNIIDKKKIFLYIPAVLFFYILTIWMPENRMVVYILYYFIILTIINIIFYIVNKYRSTT